MASAKTTTDHEEIRRWVEARGGHPAHVTRTESGDDPGVLRIDYPGYSGTDTLERLDWETFFDWFDRDKLAFLYQDERRSRFSKFVKRAAARKSSAKKSSAKKSSAGSSKKSASSGKTSKAASKKSRLASKSSGRASKSSRPSSKSSGRGSSSSRPASKSSGRASSSSRSASKSSGRASSSSRSASKSSRPASKSSRAASKSSRAASKSSRSASSASSVTTTNHDEIRKWVEARGGYPARVKATGKKSDPGILRIDYPGYSGGKTLERIDWDDWFEWFDRDKLAFLYQNKRNSRFSKLVRR